jgi:hypothetical protein
MSICFVVESIFSFGGVQRVTAVIAKELSKTAKVTIMTFDQPESKDTSLYALNEADIDYEFLAYPEVGPLKQKCCKAYSFLFRRLLPQNDATSSLYAHSSFPSERRQTLISHLNAHHFDAIIAVHAPIATRIAAIRQAKISQQETANTKRQTEDALQVEYNQDCYNLISAIESYQIQKENLAITKRVLDNTGSKYRTGYASNLEVTNASTDFITAQSNYVQAVMQVVTAQIALENLLGKNNQ